MKLNVSIHQGQITEREMHSVINKSAEFFLIQISKKSKIDPTF
jgi:hypothetical protein